MSLPEVLVAVSAAAPAHAELPIPALAIAGIVASVFLALGFVMWSFRDVANRHSHKTSGSSGHGTDH
ncbi:MAG: hypothetical protein H7146_06810 [Burkholderiaceae bacterium]|nr:hypothetical protein [Microbacteriaceae bacterium]